MIPLMSVDMVRHGDRGPTIWAPDIFKDIWAKEEIKQLTKKGEEESKDLGRYFKNHRYITHSKFLPPIASPALIYVRSTDTQRTKDAAKALLEGMFGDSSKNLTVHVKEKKDDPCFALRNNEYFYNKTKQLLIDNRPKGFAENIKSALDYINNQYGTNYSNHSDLFKIGDALYVGRLYNKPPPQNMTEEKVDELISLSHQLYLYFPSIPARNCFSAKDSVEEIVGFFDDKIANKTKLKYILLTLHDINITAMLNFLTSKFTEKPKYNANIRFDLFQCASDGKFYVTVKYNKKTINLCDKGVICSFDEFKQLIAKNITIQCSDFSVNQDYLKAAGIIDNKEPVAQPTQP